MLGPIFAGSRRFSHHPITLVVMKVGELVEVIDAEKVVNKLELLFVSHPTELTRHLIVSIQLDP